MSTKLYDQQTYNWAKLVLENSGGDREHLRVLLENDDQDEPAITQLMTDLEAEGALPASFDDGPEVKAWSDLNPVEIDSGLKIFGHRMKKGEEEADEFVSRYGWYDEDGGLHFYTRDAENAFGELVADYWDNEEGFQNFLTQGRQYYNEDNIDDQIVAKNAQLDSATWMEDQARKEAWNQSYDVTGITVDMNPAYGTAVAAVEEYSETISGLKQDIARLEQLKKAVHYGKYYGAEDFETYAARGAAIQNPTFAEANSGWPSTKKEVPNIVTFSRDNLEEIAQALAFADGSGAAANVVGDYRYSYMTEDEVNLYNYLLTKEGGETAQGYLDYLMEDLNRRAGQEMGERVRGIDSGILRTLATGAYGVSAGVENWVNGVKQAFTEERIPTSPMQYGSAYIREDLADSGPKIAGRSVGQIAYDTTVTVGNILPSVAISTIASGLGAPAAVAQTAGSTSVGLSEGGNAYNQALAEGYSKEQARTYATLVGAGEGVLQYMLGGISSLGGVSTKQLLSKVATIDNAMAQIALSGAIKLGSEIAEEELQLWLDPVFRTLIFKENFNAPTFEDMAYTALLTAATMFVVEGTTARYTSGLDAMQTQNGVAELEAVYQDYLEENTIENAQTYLESESQDILEKVRKEWNVPEEYVKIEANGTIRVKVPGEQLSNGLPITAGGNTVADKLGGAGIVLQRRVYGDDGRAVVDFDTTDHGRPDIHPTGAHKHVFNYGKKNPHGAPRPMSEKDLEENSDIIKRGENYRDEK